MHLNNDIDHRGFLQKIKTLRVQDYRFYKKGCKTISWGLSLFECFSVIMHCISQGNLDANDDLVSKICL